MLRSLARSAMALLMPLWTSFSMDFRIEDDVIDVFRVVWPSMEVLSYERVSNSVQ